jgi:cyanophycinase
MGALILAGGGELDEAIFQRFVEMAGGPQARLVVIPTAGRDERYPPDWQNAVRPFLKAGARSVRVLHTRDPAVADREDFLAPLREATGVWITGGRAWRLVDAYQGTRVVDELHLLVARGGVVGGTSAGASILASYLVRGAPEGNDIVMAPGYETGFGLLEGAAVDQHVQARRREGDLLEVLRHHPDLLGIGLDEGAAIVVRGDGAQVIGHGRVGFYDPTDPARLYSWLEPGEWFDLGRRSRAAEQPPAGPTFWPTGSVRR